MTIIIKGLITPEPFFMARPDPNQLPRIPHRAAGNPTWNITLLLKIKVINAATFDARFTILALPDAVFKLNPIIPVYTRIRTPVPGQKSHHKPQ